MFMDYQYVRAGQHPESPWKVDLALYGFPVVVFLTNWFLLRAASLGRRFKYSVALTIGFAAVSYVGMLLFAIPFHEMIGGRL